MQQHTFLQGSPEWHAHRAKSRNASDAPAMLGCSPYLTRSQLLHALHTGIRPEVTPEQQRRFDDGHAIEAAQRAAAEELIGDDLFPVVGSETVDGVLLSASFDGMTMTEETLYECKSLNADLRAALPHPSVDDNDAAALPKVYRVQMEQQLAVAKAERVLFVAANRDGTDVRRCWYYPDLALRAEIVAGWKQLEADLVAYTPPAASAVEKIVAEPVQALPAPSVQVTGELVLRDNFKVFETALRDFLEHRLIREPKTDQDFADLDVQIKAMKGAEAALESAEAQMLAQIQTVDQAKKTKDMLAKLVRDNRLMAEKLLASEKERRRADIVADGVKALADHMAALNARLGKPYMPQVPADFGGCIKGMKSLASMEDKVATELARAKIAANEIADRIDANLKHLREHATEHKHLFPDTGTIVLKACEDLQSLVSARIAEHKAAEERRLEAERTRIRAEEEARAREQARREQEARGAEERQQRAAAEEAERQRAAAAETERRRIEANTATSNAMQAISAARQEGSLPGTALDALEEATTMLATDLALTRASESSKVAASTVEAFSDRGTVHPLPTRAPAPVAGPPTLKLGEINKRLTAMGVQPNLSAAFLAALGIEAAGRDGAAIVFHEHQWLAFCDALIAHASMAREQRKAA